jgi:hypothetical protein
MKNINILGKQYTIVPMDHAECQGNMGSINREKQIIMVNKDLAIDQYKETLIHESLHIISEELNLDLDEDTIARLAVGLYSAKGIL